MICDRNDGVRRDAEPRTPGLRVGRSRHEGSSRADRRAAGVRPGLGDGGRAGGGAGGEGAGAGGRVREDDGRPRPRGVRDVRVGGGALHGPGRPARPQGGGGGLEALLRGAQGPVLVAAGPRRGDRARARSPSAPARSSTPRASAPAPSTRPGASRRTESGGSFSTAAALPAAAPEGAAHARPRPRLPRVRRGVPARDRPLRGLRRRARRPLRRPGSREPRPPGAGGGSGGRARRLPRPLRDPAGRRPRAAGRAAARAHASTTASPSSPRPPRGRLRATRCW